MKKYILIILIFILITPQITAQTIDLKTFKEIGEDTYIIEKNNNICNIIEFQELKTKPNMRSVLQLKIDDFIPIQEDVNISVYLNDVFQSSRYGKEIKENNVFKLDNFKQQNNLKICIDNNFIPKLKISKNSTVGNYLLSEIKKNNFYQIAPEIAYINELTPISVYVTNSGYDDIEIELSNATDKYIKNSNLDNVSGEVNFKGILKAGETKKIEYYIKTTEESIFISPRAILKYTNEFGEKIIKLTEPTIINLYKNPIIIDTYIDIDREILIGEEKEGKIIFRNLQNKKLENIYIIPNFNGKIILKHEKINEINAKDIKEIKFTIKTFEEKEYPLSFNIYYETNEHSEEITSQITKINSLNKDNTNTKIIAILITLTVILFIWFVKL